LKCAIYEYNSSCNPGILVGKTYEESEGGFGVGTFLESKWLKFEMNGTVNLTAKERYYLVIWGHLQGSTARANIDYTTKGRYDGFYGIYDYSATNPWGTFPHDISDDTCNGYGYSIYANFTNITDTPPAVNGTPVICCPNPANNSVNIPIDTDPIQVNISDPENWFSYNMSMSNGEGDTAFVQGWEVSNGTFNMTPAKLNYSRTYAIHVNATDNTTSTYQKYYFTTEGEPGAINGSLLADIVYPDNTSIKFFFVTIPSIFPFLLSPITGVG
jgi:hypothetical protein